MLSLLCDLSTAQHLQEQQKHIVRHPSFAFLMRAEGPQGSLAKLMQAGERDASREHHLERAPGELAAPKCELALTPAQPRLLLGKENYSLFKIASCQLSQKAGPCTGQIKS